MNQVKFLMMLLIYILVIGVDSHRILCFFPWAFKSHNILFQSLMKGLAKRGHQVDVISHYELVNPPKNYTTIVNLANLDIVYPQTQFDSIQETKDAFKDVIEYASRKKMGISLCKLLSHDKIQQLLQNPPKNPPYDLVITESDAISCYNGLGPFFNIPLITIIANKELPVVSRNVGNPLSTAFFPTPMLGKSEIKTFWDRFSNTIQTMLAIYKYYALTENQSKLMQKYLRPDIPTVREVDKMVALSIINTHHSIHGIRPTTPAFIEVAGLHIEGDESNFTRELKEWMDESKDGIVYFSLGTASQLEAFPKKTILSIYSSFAEFAPIRFLVKVTEGKKLPPGLPKNFKTMTWIPQIPVLSHNNTRVFLTHGGLHSVEEAIHFGVPIIGLPLFADQHQNVEILVKKNMAIELDYEKITQRTLTEALSKILYDPNFSKAAKYHSRLFRDRPMSPMKTAIFWIEYVIRNGPESLRSPALDLYWFQADLLDVYGFLLLCLILNLYLIFIFVKIIIKKILIKNTKLELKKD